MNKYAFFDVDYTIYNGWSHNDLVYFLVSHGFIDPSFEITIKEYASAYLKGEDDYETSARKVCNLMASVVKGKTPQEVSRWGTAFLNENNKIYSWVRPLMGLLNQNGFTIYLISATTAPTIKILADYLQTDNFFATPVVIENNVYTDMIEYVLNFEEKQKLVHRLIDQLPEKSITLGVGDSTGDVGMLSVVDNAFVIHPHQKEMITLAKKNNWKLTTDEKIISDITQKLTSLPLY